jgi:homoserine O-acetyltransferase/O-succinyltransferase
MADFDIFELGEVVLQSQMTLRRGWLAYKTHGTLNAKRDNGVLLPSYYGGSHIHYGPLLGQDRSLNPAKYFIIAPNLLGNGLSSSPSNTPPPFDRVRFPRVTLYDNVLCQERLVREKFGIEQLALVAGFSMGGQQAFHWGAIFPDKVKRLLPWCGSTKTSKQNFVFLEGIKAAIMADAEWRDGWYDSPPKKGLRAMARVYAGWFVSHAFYREEKYRELGASSLEDFLVAQEERRLLVDANDLLTMLDSWQQADISNNPIYSGDLKMALNAITARTVVMPCETDMYFAPADNAFEVAHIPKAELKPIASIWGHLAGSPGSNVADTAYLDRAIGELLSID